MSPDRGECADGCPSIMLLERVALRPPDDADEETAAVRLHAARCEECRDRLSRILADNDLLAEVASAARAHTAAKQSSGASGIQVEGYEIREEIHRGGQGVVFKAVQRSTKRTVAVKTLLQGVFATHMQRVRFEREVELAARLRHPSIVAVYESGLTESGQHYVAMEYVEGERLDRWLASEGLKPSNQHAPDLGRVLALFAKIVDAVNYAHQRGVIHRDLKPANILVEESGEPRILDFGVAKAIGAAAHEQGDKPETTRTGEFVGTFNYAAPEQLTGDPDAVDIRTDVYALGVMLYEALTGRLPIATTGSIAERIRSATQDSAPRPSALCRGIDEDTETIVLSALAKEPGRRYQSAGALLDDLERRLTGRPINARRDNAAYVLGKTLRRHRLALGVAAAFVLLLSLFSVTMSVLFVRSVRAERLADVRLGETQKTMLTFIDSLGQVDLETAPVSSRVGSIVDFLDEASAKVGDNLGDAPEIAAPFRSSLGVAYLGQSRFDDAERELRAALTLVESVRPTDPVLSADIRHNLGRILWKKAAYAEAEAHYRAALESRRRALGEDDLLTLQTSHHLASTLQHMARFDEALALYRQALEGLERTLPPNDPDIAQTMNGMSTCLRDTGRFDEAEAGFRRTLEIIKGSLGPDDWRVARAKRNLAATLIDAGKCGEAAPLLEDSLRITGAWFGDQDIDYARSLYEQARLTLECGGSASEALTTRARALAIQRRDYPTGHPELADSLALAGLLPDDDALTRSIRDLEEAVQMCVRLLPPGHWKTAVARSHLGAAYLADRRLDAAEASLSQARSALQAARPAGDREVNRALGRLIDVASARGDEESARRYESMLRNRGPAPAAVTGAAGKR